MYVVAIQVPLYVEGERTLVTTEWSRSLRLLRDSLGGRLGEIALAAPTLPADRGAAQALTPLDEGIVAHRGFDARMRAREYWTSGRRRWRALLDSLMPRARAVHAGLDDVYRPIAYEGFRAGLAAGRPTVFVQDTDIVLQLRELTRGAGLRHRARNALYARVFDRLMNSGVARADLTLLKGGSLQRRYEARCANLRVYEDTSYTTPEIVPSSMVEARLARLRAGSPLRLVYCGRLEARKGVRHSVLGVLSALRAGARLSFDVIGDGPERAACEALVSEHGAGEAVRFVGRRAYGPALLRELAGYDALLFTPLAEDTPRMVFDAYAAGLPIVAYAIDYMRERADAEKATELVEPRDPANLAKHLATLATAQGRARLEELARAAVLAAPQHAADVWYAKRAAWTLEAVERHDAGHRARAGAPAMTSPGAGGGR